MFSLEFVDGQESGKRAFRRCPRPGGERKQVSGAQRTSLALDLGVVVLGPVVQVVRMAAIVKRCGIVHFDSSVGVRC
jgi:hypothetical protein